MGLLEKAKKIREETEKKTKEELEIEKEEKKWEEEALKEIKNSNNKE